MNDSMKRPMEIVITVGGNADWACPMLPGQSNRRHWDFDGPAHPLATDEEKLKILRRMRDEIKKVFEACAAGRRDQSQPQKKLASTNISL